RPAAPDREMRQIDRIAAVAIRSALDQIVGRLEGSLLESPARSHRSFAVESDGPDDERDAAGDRKQAEPVPDRRMARRPSVSIRELGQAKGERAVKQGERERLEEGRPPGPVVAQRGGSLLRHRVIRGGRTQRRARRSASRRSASAIASSAVAKTQTDKPAVLSPPLRTTWYSVPPPASPAPPRSTTKDSQARGSQGRPARR